MQVRVEFRIFNEYVPHFERDKSAYVGRRGAFVTRVVTEPHTSLYQEIGKHYYLLKKGEGRHLFSSWHIARQYQPAELLASTTLHLLLSSYVEPTGEECGTEYDESTACPTCGTGRTQRSPLKLDLRKAPKKKDLAKTIADEWIVSERLATFIQDNKFRTPELNPILHCRKARKPPPLWYQLVVPPEHERPRIMPPTRFGIDPFDEDEEGTYVCPEGHVLGLNILSELHLSREDWASGGWDLTFTREMVGRKAGLLRPEPLIVISQRFYQALKAQGFRGFKVEVAHLV